MWKSLDICGFSWRAGRDSNPRRPGNKPGALPAELPALAVPHEFYRRADGPASAVLPGVSATEPRAAATLAQGVENLQHAAQIADLVGGGVAGIDHRVGGRGGPDGPG